MSRTSLVQPESAEKDIVIDDGEIVNVNSKGKRQNVIGQELPDPTPMAPPVGFMRQPSLSERIRDMVRSEALRVAAESSGLETLDEADDFDVGDEVDPHSEWENDFDIPVTELRQREQAERDANASFPPAIAETKLEPNNGAAGLGVRPAIPVSDRKVSTPT